MRLTDFAFGARFPKPGCIQINAFEANGLDYPVVFRVSGIDHLCLKSL
jgi:hypothetical protein